MATKQILDKLAKSADAIKAIDRERLLRPTLGEESLGADFASRLDALLRKTDFALHYSNDVSDGAVLGFSGVLNLICDDLAEQAAMPSPGYIGNKSAFLNRFNTRFEELLAHWPAFVIAAIESRGFLQDEGIRKEYERAVQDMKHQAADVLNEVEQRTSKAIEAAEHLGKQIEEKARRTARRISVEEAQRQFSEAQGAHERNVKLWALVSGGALVLFLGLVVLFWFVPIRSGGTAEAVYHTALRITALTGVGAAATFCLRVWRAHMHMQQHNLHRQRVANSMSSFVESAETPEQRDLILAHLVAAVVTFGNSGLLLEAEDSVAPTKLAIDTITRNIIAPTKH